MIIAIINKIRNEKKAREGKFTNDDGWKEILISIFKSTELFYFITQFYNSPCSFFYDAVRHVIGLDIIIIL